MKEDESEEISFQRFVVLNKYSMCSMCYLNPKKVYYWKIESSMR